jgi:hypothetical protein
MNPSIVLGIGTGRCGLRSLAKLLNQQPETQSSYEEPPLLPWKSCDGDRIVRERFARFRQNGRGRILCDVASFYLSFLDVAMAAEPDIRIICLRRPREEVVVSFGEWLDQGFPLSTNHWAQQPRGERGGRRGRRPEICILKAAEARSKLVTSGLTPVHRGRPRKG